MTTPRQQRLAGSFGWHSPRVERAHGIERLLRGIGAEPAFADDVFGDLAEERARRATEHGALHARWWYAGEVLRAVPHLAWNAVRHGGPRRHARIAAVVSAILLVPAVVLTAIIVHGHAPARLIVDGQNGASVEDGLIVNTKHPVQLAMHAFDMKGRPMGAQGVRYQWVSGDSLLVTPRGALTCSKSARSAVRASLGDAATTIRILCDPVKRLETFRWMLLVAGDSARELALEAFAPDGGRIWQIAGERRVFDTSVARLEGTSVRPLKPGHTKITMRFGDASAQTEVSVFEAVPSLAGLRPEQRVVIAPLRLARNQSIRWPLPVGRFWLRYHRDEARDPIPAFRLSGPVRCTPSFGPVVDRVGCLVRGQGASVRITNRDGGTDIHGQVSIEQPIETTR